MTEQVQQGVCNKFCIKLEHSSAETTQMIQKAAATGNWWLAASSQQHGCSCITSSAEFSGKTPYYPDDSAPLQPRFGVLWLLAFPKAKITFEREDFRLSKRFRKIRQGSWGQLGELYEVPRCLLWRGLRHQCPVYIEFSFWKADYWSYPFYF